MAYVPLGCKKAQRVQRDMEAVSSLTEQNPTGLGAGNARQITFGAAQFGVQDRVMINSDGLVAVNQSGLYRVKLALQFGRSGAGGVSELLFRFLVNGTQIGRSIATKLDNSNTVSYIENDNWFNVSAGTTLAVEVMRDLSSHNSGGLITTSPVNEGVETWNISPCAVIRFEHLE